MNALVSIIIPTFNRAHFIGETLNSIIAQTHTNWECIVVDDGSTDNTAQILANYCKSETRIQYHNRPDNYLPGGNGARNYGFTLSKGDYIQWFDSDDVMYPKLIASQIQNLRSSNKLVSICLLERYNEDLSELKLDTEKHSIKYSIYCDFALRIFKSNLQTTFFKREVVENYTFKEQLKKSQEVEFLQRIYRDFEDEIYLYNCVLVKMRKHTDSITKKYNIETLSSILDVKLILVEEFPKNRQEEVFNKLKFDFFDKLKIPFKNKRTRVYFTYLFKFKYLRLYDYFYLSLLYFGYRFFNKGSFYYEKRIKNMFT